LLQRRPRRAAREDRHPLRALVDETDSIGRVELQNAQLLPPIEAPEIWCAGVTYERSRDARLAESETDARDAYALVYEADRPELVNRPSVAGALRTSNIRNDDLLLQP